MRNFLKWNDDKDSDIMHEIYNIKIVFKSANDA